MGFLTQVIIAGIANGTVYALVAMGFVIIYKCSGVLNFAQGYMLMVAAYIFWSFMVGFGLDIFTSLLLTLPSAFIFGMLLERLTLRPLIGQSIITMVVITIFVGLALEGLAAVIWGPQPLRHVSVFPSGFISVGPATLPIDSVYTFGITISLILAFMLFFHFTRIGLAMRGIAEGHQLMQSMGISVKRIIGMAWGIAGLFAAIGGIALGSMTGFQMGLSGIGLIVIPVAFLGGLDSVGGAIAGGLIIGLIESMVAGYVGHAAATPVAYMILIAVLIFKPYGFFGLQRIERV